MTVIAMPVDDDKGLNSPISGHFGRAKFYALYDTQHKNIRIIPNTSKHMGGSEEPPVFIRNQGAEEVITSGIGPHALELFQKFKIKVYAGAQGTIKTTLESYTTKKLPFATAENTTMPGEHHHHHE